MAGGVSFRALTSTEIWPVGSEEMLFKKGPELPNWNFIGASMAQTLDKKSLILSGGFFPGKPQTHIYELTCSGKCEWKKLPTELKEPMKQHASMFIPAESFDCGNPNPVEEESNDADSEKSQDDEPESKEQASGNEAECCGDIGKMMKEVETR